MERKGNMLRIHQGNSLKLAIRITVLLVMGASLNMGYAEQNFEKPIDTPKAGELELESSTVKFRGKELPAEKGTLYVLENRANPSSNVIELPVLRVPAINQGPHEPVFLFGGGPGISNINSDHLPGWLMENHDVVMIGYRGVDGSVQLDSREINELITMRNLLSRKSLQAIGKDLTRIADGFKAKGIDLKQYNIISVVDDMEEARIALGYDKINVAGGSYGGAVAFTYCLRYPQSIHRNIMTEAAFPWNLGYAEPQNVDRKLERLNELWKGNPECVQRAEDIVETIKEVLATLPQEWQGMFVDPGKVRLMTYLSLYEKERVAQAFQAFVDAKNGDYGELAVMCLLYDQLMTSAFNTADLLAKTFGTQTDPNRDYVAEMYPAGSVIGSPLSQFAWGSFQYSQWPVERFVDTYPQPQQVEVETLLIYGSKEAGEPTRKSFGAYFTNAQWAILEDMGHMDVWTAQPEAIYHLQRRFFDEGVVDKSKFKPSQQEEWDFKPKLTLQQMAQTMMPQEPKE